MNTPTFTLVSSSIYFYYCTICPLCNHGSQIFQPLCLQSLEFPPTGNDIAFAVFKSLLKSICLNMHKLAFQSSDFSLCKCMLFFLFCLFIFGSFLFLGRWPWVFWNNARLPISENTVSFVTNVSAWQQKTRFTSSHSLCCSIRKRNWRFAKTWVTLFYSSLKLSSILQETNPSKSVCKLNTSSPSI